MKNTQLFTVLHLLFLAIISLNASLTPLYLERAFPYKGTRMSQLHAFDITRHLGLGNGLGVPQFNLTGYVFNGQGLYYTRVKMGTPAKELYVIVDTGSNLFWVTCSSCRDCPKYTARGIAHFFGPENSSTASSLDCSFCPHKHITVNTMCLEGSLCGYATVYANRVATSGYFLSDLMSFDVVYENGTTATVSTNITFGCTTNLTGVPINQGPADGIIGLAQSESSILSQLTSHEKVPRVFSHCLTGEGTGGGILLFGEISEPNLSYTPIVSSEFGYSADVEYIAVNGQVVPIDPAVFKTSSFRGAYFDSGTTLVYLIEDAYIPFARTIRTALSNLEPATDLESELCYKWTSKLEEFPIISFKFAGAATMTLRPEDYLAVELVGLTVARCIGIRKTIVNGATIIGDIALKNKIVVYDLVEKRVGWKDYNCSLPVSIIINSTKYQPGGGYAHQNNIAVIVIVIVFVLVFYIFFLIHRKAQSRNLLQREGMMIPAESELS